MQGKPIKIIIDTNLWISFLIGMKTSSAIKNILTNSNMVIAMTEILQSEIIAVASRPKFTRHFAPEACERLLTFLRSRSENYPLSEIPKRCRDPKDDYLLELARVADADFLITGDKDLIEMHQMGRCQILTLDEFKQNYL